MHDPAAMRAIQRLGDLRAVAQSLLDGKRTAQQSIGETLAFEQLEDEIVDPVLMSDVVQRANVRMRESRDRLRFALEANLELRIR